MDFVYIKREATFLYYLMMLENTDNSFIDVGRGIGVWLQIRRSAPV